MTCLKAYRIFFRAGLLAAAFLMCITAVRAQESRPLITQPIDPTRLTTLRGNTHPMALAKYDHGAAPTSLPMAHLLLILQRTPEQEAALDTLLARHQFGLGFGSAAAF